MYDYYTDVCLMIIKEWLRLDLHRSDEFRHKFIQSTIAEIDQTIDHD